MKYRVKGLCEDEEDVLHLGTVIVEVDTEQEAEQKAWEELWDPRLTGAGCRFRALIEEVEWWEVDDEDGE